MLLQIFRRDKKILSFHITRPTHAQNPRLKKFSESFGVKQAQDQNPVQFFQIIVNQINIFTVPQSLYNHYFWVVILSIHFSWQFFIQSLEYGYKTGLWCINFFLGRNFFFLPTDPKKSQNVIWNDNIFLSRLNILCSFDVFHCSYCLLLAMMIGTCPLLLIVLRVCSLCTLLNWANSF